MKHNINNCFLDPVIKKDLFKSTLNNIVKIIDKIKNPKDPLLLSFLNQFNSYEKKTINKLALYHQKNFKDVIILGTGGSSKAGRTFVQIAYRTFGRNPKFPKFMPRIGISKGPYFLAKFSIVPTPPMAISRSEFFLIKPSEETFAPLETNLDKFLSTKTFKPLFDKTSQH